ncbi:Cna protein B-type domain-containing protein [Lachnospiraceae bacterium XBB1006]|nr:Cna protein B-type domain-containing protein [Lachnospiraceae bacterium XBB1006]
MKQRVKRITAGLLAVLTIVTSLWSEGGAALAASKSANIAFWYASTKDSGVVKELKAGYDHGKVLYAMLDGHSAYCMNYGLAASGGQLMNSYPKPKTDMSAKQEKLLTYCLYYGFSSESTSTPSNSQCNKYIATQAMVWIIEKNIFGKASADSAAKKLCATAPDKSESYEYYEKLRDHIDRAYNASVPSFAARKKSDAKTYVLNWNATNKRYEKTFTDNKKVLSGFDFHIDGFKVEKNGNSMTVYTKTANEKGTLGTLKSNDGRVEPKGSCVFWLTGKKGYQEFVSEKPSVDPIEAYLKVATESVGYGELTKVDAETGEKLSGAVYGIYSDSKCKHLVAKLTTNSSGTAKSKALQIGTYYVREIKAPQGYACSSEIHTVTIKAGKTATIKASDKVQTAGLSIYKEGDVLMGWNGSNFVYQREKLPGATFQVSAAEDITTPEGIVIYHEGDIVASNLVTGPDGQAVLTDLYSGAYLVTETDSVEGYVINKEPKTVRVRGSMESVSYDSTTIFNQRQKADVSVKKLDSDTHNPVAGGQFTIYAACDIENAEGEVIVEEGEALQTITTGGNGIGRFTVDLPIDCSYYVTETQAPYGYIRNEEEQFEFSFETMPQEQATATFTHEFSNDRVTARIALHKVDKENGVAVPQGDAKLSKAVYGLYARENIVHPDGVTGVLYRAGECITTLTTDEQGEAEVDGLYLGKYYVKEITPSEGYLLDETEHDITCSYEGDQVEEVFAETTSKEQVMKQPFQFIKVSDNGDDTEAPVLAGAQFMAYLKSALPLKDDGSYDFEHGTPVVIGENGSTVLTTDEKGYAVSIPIPYGTYVVMESFTPHNLTPIKPFIVKITENHPNDPQQWRVFIDREFTAKLRIVKKDADTKKIVLQPNAEFKIFNMDTNSYVVQFTTYPSKVRHESFLTDGDGDLILPERLPIGHYRIEEVKAPFGYVLNEEPVFVDVDSDTAYEVDGDTNDVIITAEYVDAPVVGELTIEKRGEILMDYTGGWFSKSEEKDFVYEEASLAGAVYEVYAAEDIYTADMQLDENGNRSLYYAKGTLIKTVMTGEDGKAVVKNLPLGKYKVVEVEAPNGYVLNPEEQYVTFTYVDDKTPVVKEGVTFKNDRQKLSLSVIKKDTETKLPIAGAQFGLYANEDIANFNGDIIIKAGELLEIATSDANGVILFKKDYPFGKYVAQELKAPDGYVSSKELVTFTTEYKGQNVKVAEYSTEFYNIPTTFEITKTDITSGVELPGATLSVLNDNGIVIDRWQSEVGRPHVIKRLVVGKTYTLREDFAPYGYLKAEDITFTVADTAQIQKVGMKDEVPTGTIIVNKKGEFVTDITKVEDHWYDFIFNFFKKDMSGVTFEVYAAEDIHSVDGLNTIYYLKDKLVATIVTDEKGYAKCERLPLGKYYLKETKTLEGFVLPKDVFPAELSYVDQYTKVVYAGMEIENERQKVQVSVTKKDADTKEALIGAVFGMYAAEDIVNDEGKVIVAKDTLIERVITAEEGKAQFMLDLPLGKYYVKELEAPTGYVTTPEVFEVDATYKGPEVDLITVEHEFFDKPTRVEISKQDITGEHELKGAKLSILDANGNVVTSWKSDGKPHYMEKLPLGDYVLREEAAPYGYKIASDVKFTVEDKDEIQKVVMKDEMVFGKIMIEKTDKISKKPLRGCHFEIRDEDGKVVDKLVTDRKGHAESKELLIADFKDGNFGKHKKYYVVETKAPKGYILDETPHEVVLKYKGEAPEMVTYTLKVTNKPDEHLTQTGDDFNPWMYGVIGGALLLAGALILFSKKETED